ncbi:Rhodanese-like protein [Epithele typhae]|uniref:Rhodanese-like protein n=1 Tax=Epithele typhae TaxID=378194 RepID=UPI002007583B|nr:Rhodanese-like protein [Epithele typhae]KAH9921955.1 Rhodanese-like protein [Epithele typhae]
MFRDACPLVVTPAQLQVMRDGAKSAKSPELVVLDASWHMPNSPRNADQDFKRIHIPQARFLNIDRVASFHPLGLPHMMPDAAMFREFCGQMRITPSTHVVLYDTHGVFSSPRALYMFRAFGHTRSSILDGGLPGWLAHGQEYERGEPERIEESRYPLPQLDEQAVKDYDQIVANVERDPAKDPDAFYVLDARSSERFLGTSPEPRPGLSSGHMPHSISLPFSHFIESHTIPDDIAAKYTKELPATYTRLRSNQSLLSALDESLGPERAKEVLDGKRQVVASCGSGMTAGVIWLGLKMLGVEQVGIYDESWTGYAMRVGSKIEKVDLL